MQVPKASHEVSVGSFFMRLPKSTFACPSAGSTSSPRRAPSTTVVRRVLSFGIFGPFEVIAIR